jgi:hypothetical protein
VLQQGSQLYENSENTVCISLEREMRKKMCKEITGMKGKTGKVGVKELPGSGSS